MSTKYGRLITHFKKLHAEIINHHINRHIFYLLAATLSCNVSAADYLYQPSTKLYSFKVWTPGTFSTEVAACLNLIGRTDPNDPNSTIIKASSSDGQTCSINYNWGGITYVWSPNIDYYCPDSTWTLDGSQMCLSSPASSPKTPRNAPGCGNGNKGLAFTTPNPIHSALGNKFLTETDVDSDDLVIKRSYTSSWVLGSGTIGNKWRFDFDKTFLSDYRGWKAASRPNGSYLYFKPASGLWVPDADVSDTLTALTSGGWTYLDASNNSTENYNANGLLVSVISRTGKVTTYTYNASNTVSTIINELGHQLSFTYAANGNLSNVKLPNGSLIQYGYDANGNLSTVTYPDGKVKTYLYGETAYVSASPNVGVSYTSAMTGIVDENNIRYATYQYDASGRAYDEELGPNLGLPANQKVSHNNLSYTDDGVGNPSSTLVTDALGSVRTYNFTNVLGVVKSSGQSQPAGSGCAAAAANITYDANGNIASRTDFNGNKTTYVYDLTRNLETSRTEGLTSTGATTTATRTITTTWHATWRLPLVITEYTGATASGTALKKTTYVYDTKGNITSFKEEDPVRALSRTTTTTYTYSTVAPGLVVQKVVDGPRTDKSDITTYNYFDANASCAASTSASTATNLGCRGQLQTITNALSQVTTFNRYNHHGQVEQMTDPNGTVTTNTYDLRQRLLTHSISGTGITAQTTTLTYDNAGQITQLKMPDNSTLNYTYDDAHRLTQVQDTLGNKVVYTLDAADNRTAEKTYDPSGTLAKTLTRSYDALNRLQTLTGKE